MTSIYNYISIITLLALLFSCDKEDKNTHKLAGVYTVEKITQEYYSNNQVDSAFVRENPGEICLYDNGSFNRIVNTMPFEPAAWAAQSVGGADNVCWYTDMYDINSITFFTEGDYAVLFATYTIKKVKPNGRMEWYYVQQDANGDIAWVETITVKRAK